MSLRVAREHAGTRGRSSATVRPGGRRGSADSARFSARRSAAATTFVDPEDAIGKPNPAIGVSAVFLGELFGAEVDVADAPGFFETGDKHLVLHSRVTTISGNVIVAAPHRLTEYWLRPYLVGRRRVDAGQDDDLVQRVRRLDGHPRSRPRRRRRGVRDAIASACPGTLRRFQSVGTDSDGGGRVVGRRHLCRSGVRRWLW